MDRFPTAQEISRLSDADFLDTYEQAYASQLGAQAASDRYGVSAVGGLPVAALLASGVSALPGMLSFGALKASASAVVLAAPALAAAAVPAALVCAGVSAIALTATLMKQSSSYDGAADAQAQHMDNIQEEAAERPRLGSLLADRRQEQEKIAAAARPVPGSSGSSALTPLAAGFIIGSMKP